MHRQVGDLVIVDGVAKRGLLIRHLILPNGLAGSTAVLDFLKKEISLNTFINIMDQYFPCYWAAQYPELNCHLTAQDYQSVCDYARQLGFSRGF